MCWIFISDHQLWLVSFVKRAKRQKVRRRCRRGTENNWWGRLSKLAVWRIFQHVCSMTVGLLSLATFIIVFDYWSYNKRITVLERGLAGWPPVTLPTSILGSYHPPRQPAVPLLHPLVAKRMQGVVSLYVIDPLSHRGLCKWESIPLFIPHLLGCILTNQWCFMWCWRRKHICGCTLSFGLRSVIITNLYYKYPIFYYVVAYKQFFFHLFETMPVIY